MTAPSEDTMRVVHGTLFGDALNGATVAALLASEDGQYVAANDEACRLTGYDRSTLTSFRSGQLAADEQSRGIFENIMRRNQMRGEKTVRRRNGDTVHCDYWAVRTQVARIPYVLLMLWQPDAGASSTA
jgi:PAS domain S-box-containing protein